MTEETTTSTPEAPEPAEPAEAAGAPEAPAPDDAHRLAALLNEPEVPAEFAARLAAVEAERDAVRAELDGIRAAEAHAALVERVAAERRVPANLLRGETEAELVEHARQIFDALPGLPYVRTQGDVPDVVSDVKGRVINDLFDIR